MSNFVCSECGKDCHSKMALEHHVNYKHQKGGKPNGKAEGQSQSSFSSENGSGKKSQKTQTQKVNSGCPECGGRTKLLNSRSPLEAKAIKMGFEEVCTVCQELL